MAFSYWRTGNFNGGAYRAPANQGAQGTQNNTGFDGYGYQFRTQGMGSGWGRDKWNKWAWSGSCLRTDGVTGPLSNGIAIANSANTLVLDEGSSTYTIEKISGAAGYNASAVSSVGVAGDFVLRMRAVTFTSSNYYGGGMNSDPLLDTDYSSVDFLLLNAPSINRWDIYESGALIQAGIATNADYVWIWRFAGTLYYGHGADFATAQITPDRSVASAATLFFDSVFTDIGDKVEAQLTTLFSVLRAVPGAYTISGTPVGLLATRALAATPGAYALTGAAVGLSHGYRDAITPGAYTLSGQTVALKWAHRLPVNVGAYTLNGQTVGLLHGYRGTITPGAYALTGTATGLLWKHSLPITPGAYAITGTATALKWGHKTPLAPGAYAITGTPAGLLWGHRTLAVPGAYAITGTAVGLRQNRVVTIAVGAYTLNGQAVATLLGRRLTAAVGAYVLAGQSVGLTRASNTTTHATPGTYLLTGQSVGLFITHRLTATPGRYNYYGYPVTLRLVRTRFIPNNAPAGAALGQTLAPAAVPVAVAALPHMPPSVVGAATVPPPNAFVKAAAPPTVILE